MNYRLVAVLSVLLLASMTLIPAFADGSDAVSSEDYGILITATDEPYDAINVTIENGKSKTWIIYVINNSDFNMDVSFTYTTSGDEVKVVEYPTSNLLVPENPVDHQNIMKSQITLAVDEIVGSTDQVVVDFTVTVTDINQRTPAHQQHIVFNVKVDSVFDTSGQYNKYLGIYPNTLPSPLNTPWIPFLITILFWVLISQVGCVIIAPRLAKALDKHTTDDDAAKFERIIRLLFGGIVLIMSVNQGLSILGADASIIAKAMELSVIAVIVLFLILLWKVYILVLEGILGRFEDIEESSIDLTLMPLFRMIGKIVFWVIGISLILSAFGVDLEGILVSAGIVSLGITMGAQNILSQFFSGIVILMTRPFKKGDFLKINNTVYIVKKVKLMFTEFYSWEQDQIITMPNNAVTAATIVNLTKGDEAYRLFIYFSVAFGTDLKKAEQVMLDVAEHSPVVLHDSEHAVPMVRMTDFKESGIELRLAVTIRDFNGSVTAGSALRMAVYQAFLDNDIKVPYNRLEVEMLNDCFRGERRPGDVVED